MGGAGGVAPAAAVAPVLSAAPSVSSSVLSSMAGPQAAGAAGAGAAGAAAVLKPESFAAEAGISLDDITFLVGLGDAPGVGLPQKLVGGKFQRIEKRFAAPGPEFCNGALLSLAEAAASIDVDVEEAQAALGEAGVRIVAVQGVPHVSRKQFADWMAAPKPEAAAAAPPPPRITASELAARAGFEGGAADVAFLIEQGIIAPADYEAAPIVDAVAGDAGGAGGAGAPAGGAGEATFLATSADELIARIMAALQPVAQLCELFDMSVEELLDMGADQALRPIHVVAPAPAGAPDAGGAAAPAPKRATMLTLAHFAALQAVLG